MNAFPTVYATHINRTENHLPGDIVIICAEPLGRILGVEWFLQRPETTHLELGLFFDIQLLSKSLGASYYNMDANRPDCGSTLRIERERFLAVFVGQAEENESVL